MDDTFWVLFGAEGKDLDSGQVLIRTVLVYAASIMIVRLGKKRFLAGHTAFDTILTVILGSVLSRPINGSGKLMPAVAAGLVLIAMHWAISWLACRSQTFGWLVKDKPHRLVEDGRVLDSEMQRTHVSRHDLEEALRLEGNLDDLSKVRSATLERSGQISVVPMAKEPKIVELRVDRAVQTIRLEIA